MFYTVGHGELWLITLLPSLREKAKSWLIPTAFLAFRPLTYSVHTSLQSLKLMHSQGKWTGMEICLAFWGISPGALWRATAALVPVECRQGSWALSLACFSLLQLHHKSLESIGQPCEALDDALAANNLMRLRLKNRSLGD